MTKEYRIITVESIKLDPTEFHQYLTNAVSDYLCDNYDIDFEKQDCFLSDFMKDIAKSFLNEE